MRKEEIYRQRQKERKNHDRLGPLNQQIEGDEVTKQKHHHNIQKRKEEREREIVGEKKEKEWESVEAAN